MPLYGFYWVNGFPHLWRLSPSLPPQPKSVIELICHRVRLHYAVLTDKNVVKQLVPRLLSPPRGCDSKSRTSPPGPDIIIYFDLGAFATDYTLQPRRSHVHASVLACFRPPHLWLNQVRGGPLIILVRCRMWSFFLKFHLQNRVLFKVGG